MLVVDEAYAEQACPAAVAADIGLGMVRCWEAGHKDGDGLMMCMLPAHIAGSMH